VVNEATDNEEVRRVVDAIGSLEAVEDPADRARRAARLLDEWPQQHSRLREIRQQAVIAMRADGMSYRKIAEAIGVHFTRVKQIETGETTSRSKLKKDAASGERPPPE
jgi:DNA-directed RNA polymerase specialized sigma24 family protein